PGVQRNWIFLLRIGLGHQSRVFESPGVPPGRQEGVARLDAKRQSGGKVLWGQLVDDQLHATAHTSMLPAHFCWREARYIIWPTQNSAPGMANKQARFKMYPVFFPSAG